MRRFSFSAVDASGTRSTGVSTPIIIGADLLVSLLFRSIAWMRFRFHLDEDDIRVHERLALAHIGAPDWETRLDGPHGLCGAPLIGIPAPRGYDHVCAECTRLWAWDKGVLFVT